MTTPRPLAKGSCKHKTKPGCFCSPCPPHTVHTHVGAHLAPGLQKCGPADCTDKLASLASKIIFFPSFLWRKTTLRDMPRAVSTEAGGREALRGCPTKDGTARCHRSHALVHLLLQAGETISWLVCHGCCLGNTVRGYGRSMYYHYL